MRAKFQQLRQSGKHRPALPRLRQLMVRLVLLTQLPGYIAVLALLAEHYDDERRRAAEHLMSHARTLAFALGERTGDAQRRLGELALRVPTDPAGLAEFHSEALRVGRAAGLERIVLTSASGSTLVDTASPLRPAGTLSPPAWGRLGGAPVEMGKGSLAPAAGAPDLAITVQVALQDGSQPGQTLAARLDKGRLQLLLRNLTLPPHWFSAVLDRRGVIVVREPPANGLAGRLVTEPLRGAIAAQGGGWIEVTTGDGVPVVTAFQRSPGHGLVAIVSLPRAELYASVWRAAGPTVLAAVSLLSLTLWLALRMMRRLLSSVETLRQQAESLPREGAGPAGSLGFHEAALVSQRLQSSGQAMRDAQVRLQAGEERLRTILQTAREAIIVCDAAQRVLLANQAAHRIFRAAPEALAGCPLHQLLEPDTWAQYLGESQAGDGTSGPDEAGPSHGQGRRTDGSAFPIEYSVTRFTGAQGACFYTIVARDITRRLQQQASLLATRTELLRVHSDFQEALMRESASRQQAIARELHDAIGSSLVGVSLLLGTAHSFTREPEAAVLISRSQEQVTRMTQQVREISRGMMPAGEERGALLAALERFAGEMSSLPGLSCTFTWRGDFEEVLPDAGGHLFRIIQEATTNAVRHGLASHVRITLARADARCRLTVLDNGIGCDPGVAQGGASGMGMQSMRARAGAVGGSFHVSRRPGGGMRIRVAWTAHDE